jgi:hypothetical protein
MGARLVSLRAFTLGLHIIAKPTTTLSPAQVHTIQNRPIKAILGSLGVNRMLPRDVAHGPPTHGGLGLPHLLTIQGTSQIELLTGHIRQNDVNGKLTLACLDTAQLRHLRSAPRVPASKRPLAR